MAVEDGFVRDYLKKLTRLSGYPEYQEKGPLIEVPSYFAPIPAGLSGLHL